MGRVLHTNSAYFNNKGWTSKEKREFNALDIMSSFDAAYEYARKQELAFYHSYFDVDSYEAFIKELRSLFAKAGNDGQRIKSLSNAGLKKIAPELSINTKFSYRLIIKGDLCEKIPFELLNSDTVHVDGEPVYITLNIKSAQAIKSVINKEFGTQFHHRTSSGTRDLRRWFEQMLKSTAEEEVVKELSQNVTLTRQTASDKDIIVSDELKGFLFAKDLSAEERQAYLRGDYGSEARKQFQQEMGKALEQIKNFIFNSCLHVNEGARYGVNKINVLKDAATETWREIIKEDSSFFFEGDNLSKSVLGNIGEFQLALQDKYVRMVLQQTNNKLGRIIGSIIEDGRQEPRSDYQLIVELGGDVGNTIVGIQSKNIGNGSMQKVKVNTDLGLVAPNLDGGFVDAIVNSYFNTNILFETGNMTEYLIEYLNTFFWKGMNLNIGPGLNPTHTNTFYWVGGTALVPASTIIKTLNKGLITNPEFTISKAAWTDRSDQEFLTETADDGDPLFTDYWHGTWSSGWTATAKNASVYEQLLENTRIHTSFSMAHIFSANGGKASFAFFDGL